MMRDPGPYRSALLLLGLLGLFGLALLLLAQVGGAVLVAGDLLGFVSETLARLGLGRSKPEIWENFADFTAKAEELQMAATGVAEKAKAGTLPDDPKAVVGMIGGSCGGCHKVYREPEKN